jgi:heme exporter protein B
MLVLGIVLLVAVAILFAVQVASAPIPLLVTIVLGAAVSRRSARSTPADRAAARPEVMLPLLMLPILAPLLLAAVKATAARSRATRSASWARGSALLVAFDIVMIAAGAATYGFLLEDG